MFSAKSGKTTAWPCITYSKHARYQTSHNTVYTIQVPLNPHLSQMAMCFNKDVRYFRICCFTLLT